MQRDQTELPDALPPENAEALTPSAPAGDGTGPVSRQRMERAKLRYVPPKDLAVETLDPWRPLLIDERMPQKPIAAVAFAADVAPVASCMQMVLDVARHGLIAANIPCFEPMRLLRCKPEDGNPGAYIAEFEMPVLENYRPSTHQAAMSVAIDLVNFMHGRRLDDDAREALFEKFDKALPRLRRGNWSNLSTLGILQGAYELGVPFRHHGAGVYRLGWGAASVPIARSTTLGDSALSARLSLRKHITAGLLREAGLPAPDHRQVFNHRQAIEAGDQFGWPVVVKPSDLDRGEGVHLDVHKDQVSAAFDAVAGLSPNNEVLVERQVSGVCHRLFMVNGKLLFAVKRLPMGVRGDGKKTVTELVDEEYAKQLQKPHHRRTKIKPIDDEARRCLVAAGFSETSVLSQGQYAPLRRVQNDVLGGLGEDLTDKVHPENLRISAAAAALTGLQIAGVDIITEDISVPWTENGAILNEINLAPAFGGSPTSRLHLRDIVQMLVPRGGRIPISVFVGDGRALKAAEARAQSRREAGIAAFLTTDAVTTDGNGALLSLACDGVHARMCALILSQDVEEMIVVVQDDALLDQVLPVEGIDRVVFAGGMIRPSDPSSENGRHDQLVQLLNAWVWPAAS